MTRKLLELLATPALLATAGGGGRRSEPPKPKGRTTVPSAPRILVVESYSLVGAAVGGLLGDSPLHAVVETVPDTHAVMARQDLANFDLVVCELSDPPSKATDLVARLAAVGSDLPVVFLAEAESEHLLLDSLTSGAKGFFTTDCAPNEFINGLTSVLRGQYTIGTSLKRGAAATTRDDPTGSGRKRNDSRK